MLHSLKNISLYSFSLVYVMSSIWFCEMIVLYGRFNDDDDDDDVGI